MRREGAAPPLLAIFLLSATALAYEILLVRLFSIIHWHHFAFMIISLALLGYGVSGSLITLFRQSCLRHYGGLMFINVLLFGISAIGVFMLVQRLPFNALEILWDSSQWLRLFLTYLLLSLPFLFVANTIAMTMLRFDTDIGRIYGADLVGAGAGALAIMLLLSLFEPQTILRLLSLAGLAAGLAVVQLTTRRASSAAMLGVAAVLVLLLPSSWLELRLSEYKGLEQTLLVDGVSILDSHSSPVSRIDVVESAQIPLRYAPGLSLQSDSGVPEQLAVFVDGDAMSAIDRASGDSGPGYRAFLSTALPYELGRHHDEVLVLNAGTGADVLQAATFGSGHIDAVEADAQLTRLLSDTFADYAGWQAIADRVSLHTTTARAWAASAPRQYDLVAMGVPGASTGGAAGVFAFATGFDLTVLIVNEAGLVGLGQGGAIITDLKGNQFRLRILAGTGTARPGSRPRGRRSPGGR